MTFTVEKVGNMVFLETEDIIWKAWDQEEFTERKLQNALNKLQKCNQEKITVIR